MHLKKNNFVMFLFT